MRICWTLDLGHYSLQNCEKLMFISYRPSSPWYFITPASIVGDGDGLVFYFEWMTKAYRHTFFTMALISTGSFLRRLFPKPKVGEDRWRMRYKGFELSGERYPLSVLGSDKSITSTGEIFLQIWLQKKKKKKNPPFYGQFCSTRRSTGVCMTWIEHLTTTLCVPRHTC